MVYPDYQIVEISCCDFHLLQLHRSLYHGLVFKGETLGLKRAEQTVGILGCAMQGTKLHQGLVMEPRLLAIEQIIGKLGKEFLPFININRCVNVVEAGKHTIHITIYHGIGQVESNGRDGGSGIVANAFQLFKFLVISRELASIFRNYLLCAMMQVAGT